MLLMQDISYDTGRINTYTYMYKFIRPLWRHCNEMENEKNAVSSVARHALGYYLQQSQ